MTRKISNTDFFPVFIPSLVSVLKGHELDKGTQLTEQEVIAIRGKSIPVALSRSDALRLEDHRGYQDVDPAHCWETWRKLRNTMKPRQKT
jgi:hypothetical protein